jgi:hypothetical protein
MKQIRKRLTYANVMVTILAFIVLGGAAVAASRHLRKNSVGTPQLKKNAVTGLKVTNGSLRAADFNLKRPAGPQGPVGPQGLPGVAATKLFAYIADKGPTATAGVQYGSGVSAVSDPSGDNSYEVTFDQSLQFCVVQATAGFGSPTEDFTTASPAIPNVAILGANPTKVYVTFVSEGLITDTSFFISAFC